MADLTFIKNKTELKKRLKLKKLKTGINSCPPSSDDYPDPGFPELCPSFFTDTPIVPKSKPDLT